jgi:transcriptional regulator with XRE-family HTH domain
VNNSFDGAGAFAPVKAPTRDGDRSPSHIDVGVGARIRERRKLLKISQERLADALGLTFQQVQKYERGANRVSASKLYEIAIVLGVPVGYFFADLPNTLNAGPGESPDALLSNADSLELATLFARISRPRVREQVLQLVRMMAEEAEPA